MDNEELFDNFETCLRNHNSKKTLVIYSGDHKTSKCKELQEVVKGKDIIYNVSCQINALQGADMNKCSKPNKKNLQQFQTSEFLPLNLLPKYYEVPTQSGNKFETQCISDTQLVNFVQNAEALVETPNGMTQEFETTFSHTHAEPTLHNDYVNNRCKSEGFDISLKKNYAHPQNINPPKLLGGNNCNDKDSKEKKTTKEYKSFESSNRNNSETEKVDFLTHTDIVNGNGGFIETGDSSDRNSSKSPVLNKPAIISSKSNTPSPIVVNLELFETFESVAVPIILENWDLSVAKHLVNSQIINKELCIQAGYSSHNKINVSNAGYNCNLNRENNKDISVAKMTAQKYEGNDCSIEDEILFSSDEEECINKKVKKFPHTCALETSCCSELDILNDTMYVGFQTASNKSIQISSDSFSKAKIMLDESEHVFCGKEFTLTELVEMTDMENGKSGNISISADTVNVMQIEANNDNHIGENRTLKEFNVANNSLKQFKDTSSPSKQPLIDTLKNNLLEDLKLKNCSSNKSTECFRNNTGLIQNFDNIGFKTARNKPIKVSKQAMSRCKKVFQDIDLIESLHPIIFQSNKEENLMPWSKNACNAKEYSAISENELLKRTLQINQNSQVEEYHNDLSKRKNNSKDTNDIAKSSILNIPKETSLSKINKNTKEALLKARDFCYIEDKNNTDFAAFKTASNKDIPISDLALSKTKKIFQDIEIGDTTNGIKMLNKNIGFKTASNKEIMISEQAFCKTKGIFQGIEICDSPKKAETTIFDKNEFFVGFKTASNKGITISEQALFKSKGIFKDIEEHNSESTVMLDKCSVTFQTASNKEVTVSEQAIYKTKDIFNDIYKCDTTEITAIGSETDFIKFGTTNKELSVSTQGEISSDLNQNEINSNTAFAGFKTARDKIITISEQALYKTRNIFQDIDMDDSIKMTKIKTSISESKTANNNAILTSEPTIPKAKNVLHNINIDNTSEKVTLRESNPGGIFGGFKTASNKKIKVSEQALSVTKNIFQDIDINDASNINKDKKSCVTVMNEFKTIGNKKVDFLASFKTANERDVAVSKDALTKSKLLLKNIGYLSENSSNKFNTATIKKRKDEEVLSNFGDILDAKNDTEEKYDVKHNWKNKTGIVRENFEKPTKLGTDYKRDFKDFNCEQMAIEHIAETECSFDTQMHTNFEHTLYTEDFCKVSPPKPLKRSISPVFACPKAKRRRKFETPYKNDTKKDTEVQIKKKTKENETNIFFNDDYKKYKKYNLLDLEKLDKEHNNVFHKDSYILNFTLHTLLQFKFKDKRNDLTDTELNIDNLKKHFLNAVNKNIVPEKWLDNHLKMILFKLISYEKRYPNVMNNIVTAKNVLRQLKYRYDRELYNVERSALRKILEKDDVSLRTMVLCVMEIYEDEASETNTSNISKKIELLVSDSWYCVKASIDKMLTKLVCDKKIVVGSKIATHGAELLNCDQGVSPLEDTSMVRLKLFGNSTRPAKWHARLGYHGNAAILIPLSSVRPEGGKVSKVRLYVTRVYPTLYVEKFADGSTVTRSERLENLHQMRYETEREMLMEKLYEEVEKEYSDQESQDSESTDSINGKCLENGSQIARMMRKCKDPNEFRSNLTKSQLNLLEEHHARQREKMLKELNKRFQKKLMDKRLDARNVVQLLKIRVAGIDDRNGSINITKGLMSIWKPNDAILELVTEGAWIEVLNVVPTSFRNSEIQFSAGRQSVFMQSKYQESDKIKPYTKSLKRLCYEIKDLAQNPALTTDYNEIDTVGLVFLIEPSMQEFNSTKDQNFQNVYLTDANKSIICLNFWGGIKKYGFENVLDTGQIVCGINLQKRAGNSRKSIPQFRVTEFSYFTKTPKSESARKTIKDITKKFAGIDKIKFCEDCVILKDNYFLTKNSTAENITPYRINMNDYDISKNKMYIDTPLAERNKRIDDNFNLTGLDFESSFKQTDTQDLSPKTLLRKKRLNDKLAKLKMYGEPPPLSTIHILNKSKNATSAYKSPVLLKSDVSDSVAMIENKLPDDRLVTTNKNPDIPTSPIIMNRTFVRKNVNPVKLNFSNSNSKEFSVCDLVDSANDLVENVSDLVDHFAEEFDGSPPLSLDSTDCV